ncbi:MAG: MFS transporter, partial [Acidimicrobiia bacterium]
MTMQGGAESPEVGEASGLRTFHLLVANTVIASTANNFLWFALVFWVYLETRSVIATSVIGGVYM